MDPVPFPTEAPKAQLHPPKPALDPGLSAKQSRFRYAQPLAEDTSMSSAVTNGGSSGLVLPSSSTPHGAGGGSTTAPSSGTELTPMNPTMKLAAAAVAIPSSSPPSAPGPSSALRTATSIADVRAGLSVLHAREDTLSARLDALVASHADLNRDLARLDSLRAALGAQVIAARSISNTMLAG